MTTHLTHRPGSSRPNGSGRPAAACATRRGEVVRAGYDGAATRGMRDGRLAAVSDVDPARIEQGRFGGTWQPHHDGAEPAAGRRTP